MITTPSHGRAALRQQRCQALVLPRSSPLLSWDWICRARGQGQRPRSGMAAPCAHPAACAALMRFGRASKPGWKSLVEELGWRSLKPTLPQRFSAGMELGYGGMVTTRPLVAVTHRLDKQVLGVIQQSPSYLKPFLILPVFKAALSTVSAAGRSQGELHQDTSVLGHQPLMPRQNQNKSNRNQDLESCRQQQVVKQEKRWCDQDGAGT